MELGHRAGLAKEDHHLEELHPLRGHYPLAITAELLLRVASQELVGHYEAIIQEQHRSRMATEEELRASLQKLEGRVEVASSR